MMIRNSALIMSGLFNKQFFLYYEDVELSFRLRDLGYELHYLPAYKMYHEAGVSAKVEKKEGFLSPVIHYYISRKPYLVFKALRAACILPGKPYLQWLLLSCFIGLFYIAWAQRKSKVFDEGVKRRYFYTRRSNLVTK